MISTVAVSIYIPMRCAYESPFPTPHQQLLLSLDAETLILTEVKWDLRVHLICTSLMAQEFEHTFLCIGHMFFIS